VKSALPHVKSVPPNGLTVPVYEFNAGILNNNIQEAWEIRSSLAEREYSRKRGNCHAYL